MYNNPLPPLSFITTTTIIHHHNLHLSPQSISTITTTNHQWLLPPQHNHHSRLWLAIDEGSGGGSPEKLVAEKFSNQLYDLEIRW